VNFRFPEAAIHHRVLTTQSSRPSHQRFNGRSLRGAAIDDSWEVFTKYPTWLIKVPASERRPSEADKLLTASTHILTMTRDPWWGEPRFP
jgi:hypothetical protein